MMIAWRLASVLAICAGLCAPAAASDREDIERLLHEFLASSHQRAAHLVFWADDLVYTSSNGTRFGRAEIVSGFDEAPESTQTPAVVYSGDQVDIRLYGDTAIVAFRLIGTPADAADDASQNRYYNTGTLLKRDGAWQVVAWQATKIPQEEQSQ